MPDTPPPDNTVLQFRKELAALLERMKKQRAAMDAAEETLNALAQRVAQAAAAKEGTPEDDQAAHAPGEVQAYVVEFTGVPTELNNFRGAIKSADISLFFFAHDEMDAAAKRDSFLTQGHWKIAGPHKTQILQPEDKRCKNLRDGSVTAVVVARFKEDGEQFSKS